MRKTERIWNGDRSRKLPSDIQDRALIRLRMLNEAEILHDFATRLGIACMR
jgi:proteic killer suppression protein